jgi:GT2 family glycosyltransferase
MCLYATEENGKLKYVKQCLESLCDTVDVYKHRIHLINNSQFKEAKEYISSYKSKMTIVNLNKNVGTAKGINLALILRREGEVCIKCDDDLTWSELGWVEKMEQAIKDHPEIGICGLKRDDITQNPKHKDPNFRTIIEGDIEWCHDIMGTCTAFNPLMLDKIGYMVQPSVYGFDDTIMSVRSEAAGFRNCFLPKIKITNLDEGGTEYTEWKKREAGIYLEEVSLLCDYYKSGKLDVYYDGGF